MTTAAPPQAVERVKRGLARSEALRRKGLSRDTGAAKDGHLGVG
jgi:hypothetical protein